MQSRYSSVDVAHACRSIHGGNLGDTEWGELNCTLSEAVDKDDQYPLVAVIAAVQKTYGSGLSSQALAAFLAALEESRTNGGIAWALVEVGEQQLEWRPLTGSTQ